MVIRILHIEGHILHIEIHILHTVIHMLRIVVHMLHTLNGRNSTLSRCFRVLSVLWLLKR